MSVCLSMIVLDEAEGIVQTLESVKPHIDSWAIIDTGSSDNTPALIEKCLHNVPGKLYHEPFVDFATTRNRALDLADGDWSLLMSGDDRLEGDGDLRAFLAGSQAQAHDVRIHFGSLDFNQVRLVRNGTGWKYSGPTHEVFQGPGLGNRPSQLAIRSYGTSKGKRQRWLLDKDLLTAERLKDPTNPRWCFYLGQTCELLGEMGAARALYLERTMMGGFEEERWEALLRAGRITPGLFGAQLLSKAAKQKPHRAEPLYHLARLYQREPNLAPLMMAHQAASKTFPTTDRLFVDRTIYESKARRLVADLT